jgi:hypothetical protein
MPLPTLPRNPLHAILYRALELLKSRPVLGRVETLVGYAEKYDTFGGYNADDNVTVQPGMLILSGQGLVTDATGTVCVRLQNGVNVYVNANSRAFFLSP